MRKFKLKQLVNKHTKAQEKANELFVKILAEANGIGLDIDDLTIQSCLHHTEPSVFAETILDAIKEENRYEKNQNYGK